MHYYRELGRHMGIRDVPEDYAGFARLLDTYEAEHFACDERSREVADATLQLGYFRSYPGGHLVEQLGTFPGAAVPSGCPVHGDRGVDRHAARRASEVVAEVG